MRGTEGSNTLPKTAAATPLPGAICEQWVKCGRARCKCGRGHLHGPYYYRFYWESGRQRKQYVPFRDLEATLKRCELNEELRDIVRLARALARGSRARRRKIMAELSGKTPSKTRKYQE